MFENITPEEFESIAQGVQATLVSLGVILGGLWAVFVFLAQRHEWLVKRQPLIKLTLKVEQKCLPNDSNLYLYVIAQARNDGNSVDYIYYSQDDHLSLTRIELDEEGNRLPAERITRVLERSKGRKVNFNTILPGNVVELPFWVKVPKAGLYHVRFYFKPNNHQLKLLKAAGHLKSGDSVVISANQYFVVEPNRVINNTKPESQTLS